MSKLKSVATEIKIFYTLSNDKHPSHRTENTPYFHWKYKKYIWNWAHRAFLRKYIFIRQQHSLSEYNYNHKIATPTCFGAPVPTSGGVLSHVIFKTWAISGVSSHYAVIIKIAFQIFYKKILEHGVKYTCSIKLATRFRCSSCFLKVPSLNTTRADGTGVLKPVGVASLWLPMNNDVIPTNAQYLLNITY